MLHSIDQIFCPLDDQNPTTRKEESPSVKKFLRGYGYCETRKGILGWIIDNLAMTVELPAHGRKRLQAIL